MLLCSPVLAEGYEKKACGAISGSPAGGARCTAANGMTCGAREERKLFAGKAAYRTKRPYWGRRRLKGGPDEHQPREETMKRYLITIGLALAAALMGASPSTLTKPLGHAIGTV